MNMDDKLLFEAYMNKDKNEDWEGFAAVENEEPALDWYKSKVKEWAGEKPTSESMIAALDKAWSGAGHARFKYNTLHNELLQTRGESNKKRKFMKAGYYPPEGKFDPGYMKNWLQREIFGEFMVKRDGPTPFYTPR